MHFFYFTKIPSFEFGVVAPKPTLLDTLVEDQLLGNNPRGASGSADEGGDDDSDGLDNTSIEDRGMLCVIACNLALTFRELRVCPTATPEVVRVGFGLLRGEMSGEVISLLWKILWKILCMIGVMWITYKRSALSKRNNVTRVIREVGANCIGSLKMLPQRGVQSVC